MRVAVETNWNEAETAQMLRFGAVTGFQSLVFEHRTLLPIYIALFLAKCIG
jgi:hypothetical protein